MWPKSFSFFQLLMYFTLFKNKKKPITICTVAIKTVVSFETYLRSFRVTLSKRSMVYLRVVKLVKEFDFRFRNVRKVTPRLARYTFYYVEHFFRVIFERSFLNYSSFLVCFCSKSHGSTYKIADQARFLAHGSYLFLDSSQSQVIYL